jgi:hypothetical protein
MRDFFPPLGVRGKDRDHAKARVQDVKIVSEREAVRARELDPDQDLAFQRCRTYLITDEREGLFESTAVSREAEWLGVRAAAGPDDEHMVKLPGIDADDSDCMERAFPLSECRQESTLRLEVLLFYAR